LFLFRIIIPLILIGTLIIWLLGLPRAIRLVSLGAAIVSLVVSAAILAVVALSPDDLPVMPTFTPVPTPVPAPTRPSEGPSYATACQTFWRLNKDIEDGTLSNAERRAERFDEFRRSATFPTVAPNFEGLVEDYIASVEMRFAAGSNPFTSDLDEIERDVRNARVRISSECARRG
jgi:hypothetical protein